jgi:hypothetical protein
MKQYLHVLIEKILIEVIKFLNNNEENNRLGYLILITYIHPKVI